MFHAFLDAPVELKIGIHTSLPETLGNMVFIKTMQTRAYASQQVAHLFGLSRTTVYREIQRGRQSSAKIDRRRVSAVSDLKDWLGSDRVERSLQSQPLRPDP